MDVEALTTLYRYDGMAMNRNLEGITHEESLRAPESGNCLNWVVGHLILSRNLVHKMLGLPPVWEAGSEHVELYKRGSQGFDPSAAAPFEDLVASYTRSQEQVLDALGQISAEALARPAKDETVGAKLVQLGFHEAYHAGQVGLLRRLLGKEGAIP